MNHQTPVDSADPRCEDMLEETHQACLAYIERNRKRARLAVGLSIASAWVGVVVWVVLL